MTTVRQPHGTGQQRADLADGGRVVQHHQDLLARQQRPVQLRTLLQPSRDRWCGNSERAQEPFQGGRGRQRRSGVVAAQVHKQLAIGEAPADPVGQTDGERGLAHPSRPGDHHHRHRAVRPVAGVQRVQLSELGGPADKAGHIARELPRHRNLHTHRGRAVEVHAAKYLPGLHHVPGRSGQIRPHPTVHRPVPGPAR